MYLKVKVFPESPKDLVERDNNRLRVFVRAKATMNQANVRARELLAHELKIPKEKLRLVQGHHGQNKTFEVLN